MSIAGNPLKRIFPWSGLLVVAGLGYSWSLAQQPSSVDFSRDIQPILQKNCYRCHGPNLQQSDLRLDLRPSALAGGQHGPIIRPGNAAQSPLYQRVAGLGGLVRMPFEGTPLSPGQIDLIRAWIDQGAHWPEELAVEKKPETHWAYLPPTRPELPGVRRRDWERSPVDRFILARLEQEGLSPAEEADRVTLLRRLSLDLIGLPPTIEEAEQFLADRDPNAYEKQVERLLASPHYGERWARPWLDLAGYADSDGFEKDLPRQVWFYRDWVIRALNRDLPYDRFLIEQVAGDMVPGSAQEQRVATGFLRNAMLNQEGGIDPEQFRMEAMFSRMETVGRVLGVTLQCAQCHNHKYDPLTQIEYYRLFAFLNNSHESIIPVYTEEQQSRRNQVLEGIKALELELQRDRPDWRQGMAEWEETLAEDPVEWTVIQPEVEEVSSGGQKYLPLPDGSFLAQGFIPGSHRVKMTIRTELQGITGFRLELMTDPNLPLGGPGRAMNGSCALTEFEVDAAAAASPEQTEKVQLTGATADLNLPETYIDPPPEDPKKKRRSMGPAELAIDGKDETAWGIDAGPVRRNQPRKAVFTTASAIAHPGGTELTFYLSQKHGGRHNHDQLFRNLGRFRLSITTTPDPVADPLPEAVRDVLSVPRPDRTPEQIRTVFSYWRTTVPEWQATNEAIEKLWQSHPEGHTQLVFQERGEPRTTFVLRRGDFLRPAAPIDAAVPAFLHPLPDGSPGNRMSFAKWLASNESPTTARALVNRVWQAYFGTGLVESSEDLGVQSEAPSHPALLDWLAVEFMEKGWSLKKLHRLIVSSAVYRQSSRVTAELLERDPYNRLLARGPRFRVEAEVVRDIALAAAGLLNPKMGGPSVYPPMPAFLLEPPNSYGPKYWEEATGEDRYRRALYTFRFRSVPYAPYQIFDAPSGEFSCTRRPRSNTPLQALTMLNEPLFVEAARSLAEQTLLTAGTSDRERLVYAFRRCLTREPTAEEREELLALLSRQQKRFESGELNPWEMLGQDPATAPELPAGATPHQAAAWTAVSRVLLNLDETITRE